MRVEKGERERDIKEIIERKCRWANPKDPIARCEGYSMSISEEDF